jgi:hypothetical protein
MGDPFLNYFALFLLVFVVVVLFYGIIAIHDIPYMIAEARHHPHQDAIYAAGWVSLFTLHAIWPFLWIWAMAYRPDRGWGFTSGSAAGPPASEGEVEELRRRIAALETAHAQAREGGTSSQGKEIAGKEAVDKKPREVGKRREGGKRAEAEAPAPDIGERTGDK